MTCKQKSMVVAYDFTKAIPVDGHGQTQSLRGEGISSWQRHCREHSVASTVSRTELHIACGGAPRFFYVQGELPFERRHVREGLNIAEAS